MRWIIQENLYNETGFHDLLRALDMIGSPYSVHKVVPFSHELIPEPVIQPGERVIVCGAYTMTKIAAREGWSPGAYMNGNFEFEVQVDNWRSLMLNDESYVCRFDQVEKWYEPFFIRPTSDSKVFAGEVMYWEGFCEWRDRVLALDWEASLQPDTMVIVSRVKKILKEYRTWVIGGKIVTSSLYKEGNRVLYSTLVPDGVIEFANDCIKRWSPHDAYVLDIADTGDSYRIIEINCLNSAGFYAGNVGKIVQALEDLDERINPAAVCR